VNTTALPKSLLHAHTSCKSISRLGGASFTQASSLLHANLHQSLA
jgi:hypothetical protein